MLTIDRFVDEAIEEELAGVTAADESWWVDLQPLLHAMGQVWRDLPPEVKQYLMQQAWDLLKRAVRDPKGAFREVVQITRSLIGSRQMPPLAAARSATHQVLNRSPKATVKYVSPALAKVRGKKKIWKRGRPSGTRFEAWI